MANAFSISELRDKHPARQSPRWHPKGGDRMSQRWYLRTNLLQAASSLVLMASSTLTSLGADVEPSGYVKALTIKTTHSSAQVAFSCDGKRIASGHGKSTSGMDVRVVLWNAQTGEQLLTLANQRPVSCIDFSPDGTSMATGDDKGTLEIWNVHTGKRSFALDRHTGQDSIHQIDFDNDGKRIVCCGRRNLVIWDLQTRKELLVLPTRTPTRRVCFSPDGQYIAHPFRSYGVDLRNAENGAILRRFRSSPRRPALALAFSPNGQRLACGGPGADSESLKVLDVETMQDTHAIRNKNKKVIHAVAYSPDGAYIFSGGYDKVVTIRDANTGQVVDVLDGHELPERFAKIRFIGLSEDGQRMVSAGGDTIIVWKQDARGADGN